MTKAKGQTPLQSLVEACTNVAVGYGLAVWANIYLLPLWGFQVSPRAGMEIGLLFTLLSLFRSFFLRRIFNFFQR